MDMYPAEPFSDYADFCSGRLIVGEADSARIDPVLILWELRQGEFEDQHPYDEFNFVLEGELEVECEGESIVATVGDTVRVPAGSIGKYRASEYAKMFAIYGPNPEGRQTIVHSQRSLSDVP